MSIATRLSVLLLSGLMAIAPTLADAQSYDWRRQGGGRPPASGSVGDRSGYHGGFNGGRHGGYQGGYDGGRHGGYDGGYNGRRHGGYNGGYRRDRGGDDAGAAVAAGIIGLAIGAIAAGAAQQNRGGGNSHIRRCMNKYRSYDPGTNTYLGHDGNRYYCR